MVGASLTKKQQWEIRRVKHASFCMRARMNAHFLLIKSMTFFQSVRTLKLHIIKNNSSIFFFPTEKEQQEAIEHIDEVQNEIDR